MYVVFVGGVLIGFCLLLSPVKVFHKLIKIKSNQSQSKISYFRVTHTALVRGISGVFTYRYENYGKVMCHWLLIEGRI